MVENRVSLGNNHVGQIPCQGITPQIPDIFRPFGIVRNVMPIVGDLYSQIPGAAMDCQPAFTGFRIFAVFHKMVTSAESAEAFVENALLQFYPAAEVGYETGIYAGRFIDEIRCA